MLTQLTIKNFGLIDRISLEFDPQLNILTGETGAGKSIIIGALRGLLGERIVIGQFREKDKNCVLEACFDLSTSELLGQEIVDDYLDGEDELIIQRIIQPDGRSKVKCNGMSLTLSQLKDIGKHLIDFHGPHDHQMLFDRDSHRSMLDRLVDFGEVSKEYHSLFLQYQDIKSKLNSIESLRASRERETDLLAHQVKELEQVPLTDEEYEFINQEQIKLNNAEKLNEHISSSLNQLSDDDFSVGEQIRRTFSSITALNHLDDKTQHLMDFLTQIQDLNEQMVVELRDYSDGLSFNEQQAKEINDKYDIYYDIKRKYGPEISDAQEFYLKTKEKFEMLNSLDENDKQLKEDLLEVKKKLKAFAAKMTKSRKKQADHLKTTIESELTQLGIAHVQFECRITADDFSPYGADAVEFYISPNAGEELKPLAQIVSSGEAARVMLALKKALVEVDPIPVLIFDEIDAQIGGRLGTITGQKLRDISRKRQVLLITHLPQIASFADVHFKVVKSVKDKRAITEIIALNDKQRIEEIAQMMSGKAESDISIKHAADMLANAAK